MSVYTRTGDKGKTSLYQGKRISKGSLRVEAYGSVDELNSAIGVVLSEVQSSPARNATQSVAGGKFKVQSSEEELIKIQSDLFEIGAALANPHSTSSGQAGSKTLNLKLDGRVSKFENIIDELDDNLPPLSNFILPGGGRAGSFLHLARTVRRRAERRIVELSEKEEVQNEIIIYINRLSDLLFMFAREVNFRDKRKEVQWKSR